MKWTYWVNGLALKKPEVLLKTTYYSTSEIVI